MNNYLSFVIILFCGGLAAVLLAEVGRKLHGFLRGLSYSCAGVVALMTAVALMLW